MSAAQAIIPGTEGLMRKQEELSVVPMRLIEIALQQGADVDKLEKLLQLQLQWEKNEARKAFVSAMNAFKENPPEINKNKHVAYKEVEYWHATLDNVVNAIGKGLSRHGISHRWRTDQGDGRIRVACILTHEKGHSEETTLEAGPDTTGSKNSIQAVGSTVTYLQRYTLLAATGLATKGQDDDGKAEGLGADAVEDYLLTIQESGDISELQTHFATAYKAAKDAGDRDRMQLFIKAKDARKAALRNE